MSHDMPSFENVSTATDTVTEETTSSDTAPEGASTEQTTSETPSEAAKRSYTSPRTNFGNEALAIVALLRTKWETEEPEIMPDGTRHVGREAVLSVLSLVSEQIVNLRDNGRPEKAEGEARVRSSTPNPFLGKHHFVALTTENTLTYIDCKKRPVPANLPANVAHLFGPFNTKAGAEYAVSHGIEGRNQIF